MGQAILELVLPLKLTSQEGSSSISCHGQDGGLRGSREEHTGKTPGWGLPRVLLPGDLAPASEEVAQLPQESRD